MGSLLIGIFTLILVFICVALVLVILMQRPSANAGMGAALGGGAAESTFGGEAGNVLTRFTVKLTVAFFVISAGLFMGYIYLSSQKDSTAPTTLSISAVSDKSAKPAKVETAANAAAKKLDEDAKAVGAKKAAPATGKPAANK